MLPLGNLHSHSYELPSFRGANIRCRTTIPAYSTCGHLASSSTLRLKNTIMSRTYDDLTRPISELDSSGSGSESSDVAPPRLRIPRRRYSLKEQLRSSSPEGKPPPGFIDGVKDAHEVIMPRQNAFVTLGLILLIGVRPRRLQYVVCIRLFNNSPCILADHWACL
jgi:hypothetical protein